MKRILMVALCLLLTGVFILFAAASGSSGSSSSSAAESVADKTDASSDVEKAQSSKEDANSLGEYSVVIDSCRLAEDYSGNPVVIVKYIFTNNNDDATSFNFAFTDEVFQGGVGLNKAYVLPDSADYSSDNQTKKIRKGSSFEVEVAYKLNDTTTDITVDVSELISFSDKKVTRTFSIS